MLQASLQKAYDGQYPTPVHFIDEILQHIYPALFELSKDLSYRAMNIREEAGRALVLQYTEKINDELDDLYRKEKLVLFPYIRSLHGAAQKSETCKPFKNIKQCHNSLLKLMYELRTLLKEEESNFAKEEFLQSLSLFQSQQVLVQTAKEKYLFAAFRSCNGCERLKI